jgi:hypothetical protein
MLDGIDVLYLHKLDGRNCPPMGSRTGGRMPAYCNGVGKASWPLRQDTFSIGPSLEVCAEEHPVRWWPPEYLAANWKPFAPTAWRKNVKSLPSASPVSRRRCWTLPAVQSPRFQSLDGRTS